MNNHLSIIIFWILALSCNAPVSSLHKDKVLLISAEKTVWFGGRPGVRGIVYTIVLQAINTKDNIKITSLKAEGNIITFTQTNSANHIIIKGNLQMTDPMDNFENAPSGLHSENSAEDLISNKQDNWIEYKTRNSERSYKIHIPEFVSAEPEGQLIPQRQ
ncbi:hypothetical protein [Chryseobacterium taichungense]|uniref:hypothetical protein n=1 Tax=Chryseobacterium taichungense TaxID=295069 RepID=UPI0028AB18A4|nr:hypothetical protein [Chryseobacterium taichungense]